MLPWLRLRLRACRGRLRSLLHALNGRLLSPPGRGLLSRLVAGNILWRHRRAWLLRRRHLLWRCLPLRSLLLAQLFLLRTLGGQRLGLLIPSLCWGCWRRYRLLACGIILLLWLLL